MREQAQKISSGLFNQKKPKILSSLTEIPAGENSSLFWGNSLNEMGFDKAIELAKNKKPKYLIWIEPGTKEVFHNYNNIRRQIEDLGYEVLFPCASNGVCPIIGEKDWCHQVLTASLPSDVERLSQLIKIDRKTMPFVGHI
jgi:hypothetical protein